MRVLFITNLFPPYTRGGAEAVVYDDALRAAKDGADVSVITTCPWNGWRSLWPQMEILDGLRVWRFFPLNVYHTLNDHQHSRLAHVIWHIADFFNFHSALTIFKILSREKPDRVITHNLKGIGMLTPWILRRQKIPHTHFLHDVQLVTPSGLIIKGAEESSEHKSPAANLFRLMTRRFFGSPEEVTGFSSWVNDLHTSAKFFPRSKFSVRRMLAPEILDRVLLPFSKPARNFFYIGQIEKHKGIFEIVKAWRAGRSGGARLHFVGDGSAFDELRKMTMSDGDIILHGRKTGEELEEFWRQADVLVAPSLCYENSPVVVAEALRHSVPMIVSDIGGAPEMVKIGRNGWIVEAGNVKQIGDLLQKIIVGEFSTTYPQDIP